MLAFFKLFYIFCIFCYIFVFFERRETIPCLIWSRMAPFSGRDLRSSSPRASQGLPLPPEVIRGSPRRLFADRFERAPTLEHAAGSAGSAGSRRIAPDPANRVSSTAARTLPSTRAGGQDDGSYTNSLKLI